MKSSRCNPAVPRYAVAEALAIPLHCDPVMLLGRIGVAAESTVFFSYVCLSRACLDKLSVFQDKKAQKGYLSRTNRKDQLLATAAKLHAIV